MITDTEVNLNSISFSESSLGISQLKISIKNHNKIIEKITKEEHLNLTEVSLTSDIPEEKKFLEELDKIILNQADGISSNETLQETASTLDLCDLKIRSDPLSVLKSLNQPTLKLSPSFSRSILIPLFKEIHKTSCFFKDKGTSIPLGISNYLGTSNLLVSENLENERIVSKLFIPKKY